MYIAFSSVQSLSHVRLFTTPWTAACQASLSFTISQSLLKLMSVEWVIPSNHLILCCPRLLPPSIFPSIRVFSNESVLHISCIISIFWFFFIFFNLKKKKQKRCIFGVGGSDCCLPGSSVHGILQARTLDWVAIPVSRGSSQTREWTRVSHNAGRLFTIWTTREFPRTTTKKDLLGE